MTRFPVLVTAFVLVVTACGAGASPAPRLSNVAAHTHPSCMRSRRPGGTVRDGRRRSSSGVSSCRRALGGSESRRSWLNATPVSILTETAWRFAFRRVRMPLESVFAFLKAHPPAGFRYIGGGGLYRSLDFDNGGMGSRERLLTVDLARLADRTVMRLEAGVPWIDPRSPREVVPAGVRELDIRDRHVRRNVTKPANVVRIVRWFDALNVVPGTIVSCVAASATRVTFVFRSAHGAALAGAFACGSPANGCSPVEFTIGGKRQIPLVDSSFGRDTFLNRVQRLLGLRFPTR